MTEYFFSSLLLWGKEMDLPSTPTLGKTDFYCF